MACQDLTAACLAALSRQSARAVIETDMESWSSQDRQKRLRVAMDATGIFGMLYLGSVKPSGSSCPFLARL